MKIYAKTGKELVENVQIGDLVKSNLFFGDENFRMIYKIENNKFYIFPEYKNDIEYFLANGTQSCLCGAPWMIIK